MTLELKQTLFFNPLNGVESASAGDIRSIVEDLFISAFRKDGAPDISTESSTPVGQLIDSITAIVFEKNSQILYLSNMFDPETNEGIWQDAISNLYNIRRIKNNNASAVLSLNGLAGTYVKSGSVFSAPDIPLNFISTKDIYLNESGYAEVVANSVNSDYTGSIPAGSINSIVTVTPGLDSVINNYPGVMARKDENRIEFEKRRAKSLKKNGNGSVDSVEGEILSISGVEFASVLENFTGEEITERGVTIEPHSIRVSVLGGDDDEIARAIYEKKSVGCGTTGDINVEYQSQNYKINRIELTPVFVKITYVGKTSFAIEEIIKKEVVKSIEKFSRESSIFSSYLYCDILSLNINSLNISRIELSKDDINFYDYIEMNQDELPYSESQFVSIVK